MSIRLRGVVTRILLVLVSSTVALGGVELVLRWRYGRPLPQHGAWIDLTKLGFRYGTYRVQKDPMTVRIVGIGDSFAYGPVQPTYNYHQLIQEALRSRLGRPVEVINLGRPSLGPSAELTILRDLGLRFKPDLVLWMLFTGNDLTDDQPTATYELDDILGRRTWEEAHAPGAPVRWHDRLRVAGYARFLATYWRHSAVAGDDREGNITMNEANFQRIEMSRVAFLLDDARVSAAFTTSVKPRLEKAIELCETRAVPFVLAIAPDQAEVEDTLARQILCALENNVTPPWDDGEIPADAISFAKKPPLSVAHDSLRALARPGVWVVDLCDPFRQEGASGGLYIERHTHWNRAGNRLAADVLTDTLTMILRSRGRTR